MDYYFIAYIFLCLAIGLGGVVTLHKMERPYSAVICFIMFLLVFIFFGKRWFAGTALKTAYKGTWPPMINMCPDYLVVYNKAGQNTCIDISGVATRGTLKAWNQDDNPQNPPADPQKYFNYVYTPGMTPQQLQVLCQATIDAGLTWEGISNGVSCTFGNSGLEDGNDVVGKGANCKA